MKPLPVQSNTPARTYRWLPLVLIILLSLVVLLIIRRFPNEKRFSVVTLYGKGAAINMSKTFHFAFFSAGQKHKGALLAEKNDLLGYNDSYIFYRDIKMDTLKTDESGDSMMLINGKINSLIINADGDLLPWFRQMKPRQIKELGTLVINGPVPDPYIPHLKEIARLHPSLSLVFTENDSINLIADFRKKTDFFQPLLVSLPVSNKELPSLSHWKNATCLYIHLTDSVISLPLPAMPALEECIVLGDEVISMTPDFFIHNPQLKKLSLLMDAAYTDLLSPLKQLDELVLYNSDSIPSLTGLSSTFGQLSVLIISGKGKNIDQLNQATQLKWLGLPENTSQQEFNQLMSNLKKLQVVELTGSDSITDYRAFRELTDLSGLVITDTVTDKSSLSALKKLRYLSLPQDTKADSSFVREMEKALPGCIIVANSGACLGSGWLLLLLPLVVLSGILFYKKQSH